MRWKRHLLASNGYFELGMFDDAAQAIEQIEPENKRRREVLHTAVMVYQGARHWKKAVASAADLVKAEPTNSTNWITLANAVSHVGSVNEAETVLLKARMWHPRNSLILFKLACCASVTERFEEAKVLLNDAIDFNKNVRQLALKEEDLRPLWNYITSAL
jgi:lipopolysaccharide biosynthesis regulator YciM